MDVDGAAHFPPDAGEMRFSRADGPGEDDDRRRPARPGIDDRNGGAQTLGDQEVVAARSAASCAKDQRQLLACGLALRISVLHVIHWELISSSGRGHLASLAENRDRSQGSAKARNEQGRRRRPRPAPRPAARRNRRARRRQEAQTSARPDAGRRLCRRASAAECCLRGTDRRRRSTSTRPIQG